MLELSASEESTQKSGSNATAGRVLAAGRAMMLGHVRLPGCLTHPGLLADLCFIRLSNLSLVVAGETSGSSPLWRIVLQALIMSVRGRSNAQRPPRFPRSPASIPNVAQGIGRLPALIPYIILSSRNRIFCEMSYGLPVTGEACLVACDMANRSMTDRMIVCGGRSIKYNFTNPIELRAKKYLKMI